MVIKKVQRDGPDAGVGGLIEIGSEVGIGRRLRHPKVIDGPEGDVRETRLHLFGGHAELKTKQVRTGRQVCQLQRTGCDLRLGLSGAT